jgi:MSHA biogenesis protein MshO
MRMIKACPSGFTVIELITVIVLLGSLVAVLAIFIVVPMRAIHDMQRRAELVDEAQLIIERMAREIRSALPNSARIGSAGSLVGLEIVSTRTGGRYRQLTAGGGAGDTLNRTQASDSFDVLGTLPGSSGVDPGAAGIDCVQGNGDCISIFNTGPGGFDVYAGDNIAKVVSVTPGSLGYANGGITPAFRQHSPQQRFYVIDDVVSFVCDTASGRLQRHSGYGLNASQDLTPGGTAALLGRDVTGCSFSYSQGTSSRAGLVTIDVTIRRDGETVRLLQQTHVLNAP